MIGKVFLQTGVIVVMVSLFFCSKKTTIEPEMSWEYQQPEQVTDGWETASLESVGMDSDNFE